MLLSAQRVLSPHGVSGINRYVYRHSDATWDVASLDALARSGHLQAQDFEVPPGGNDVRSYLDIFAPEDTTVAELSRIAAAVRGGPDPSAFPAEFPFGSVVFRFGLVFGLVPSWRNELTDLASRLLLSAEDGR